MQKTLNVTLALAFLSCVSASVVSADSEVDTTGTPEQTQEPVITPAPLGSIAQAPGYAVSTEQAKEDLRQMKEDMIREIAQEVAQKAARHLKEVQTAIELLTSKEKEVANRETRVDEKEKRIAEDEAKRQKQLQEVDTLEEVEAMVVVKIDGKQVSYGRTYTLSDKPDMCRLEIKLDQKYDFPSLKAANIEHIELKNALDETPIKLPTDTFDLNRKHIKLSQSTFCAHIAPQLDNNRQLIIEVSYKPQGMSAGPLVARYNLRYSKQKGMFELGMGTYVGSSGDRDDGWAVAGLRFSYIRYLPHGERNQNFYMDANVILGLGSLVMGGESTAKKGVKPSFVAGFTLGFGKWGEAGVAMNLHSKELMLLISPRRLYSPGFYHF